MPTKKKQTEETGPFWVQDSAGNAFVWHDAGTEGLTYTDESPYNRNGGFRTPEPADPDPAAPAATAPRGE